MGLKKNKNNEQEVAPVTNPAENEYTNVRDLSTERLNLAVELVKRKFNITEDYRVVKFNDKGKVVDISLDGPDFIVAVTIKNSEMQGMYIPPTPAAE